MLRQEGRRASSLHEAAQDTRGPGCHGPSTFRGCLLLSITLGSLPLSYDPHIFAINTRSSVLGMTLSPNELMRAVTDELDRRAMSSVGTEKENDVFYSRTSTSMIREEGETEARVHLSHRH